MSEELSGLFSRALALQRLLASAPTGGAEETELGSAALRLKRSVIRPLASVTARVPGTATGIGDPLEAVSGALLWELTVDATRLWLTPGAPAEIGWPSSSAGSRPDWLREERSSAVRLASDRRHPEIIDLADSRRPGLLRSSPTRPNRPPPSDRPGSGSPS
jgi:hypothetical protein